MVAKRVKVEIHKLGTRRLAEPNASVIAAATTKIAMLSKTIMSIGRAWLLTTTPTAVDTAPTIKAISHE